MTYKDYSIVMAIATVAAWVAWIVVLVAIDHSSSGWLGFLFFFLTLGIAIMGTLSIVGAGIRIWIRREELVSRHVSRSFRQGLLLALLGIGALGLLAASLFTWWTALLLILIISLFELVFLSAQKGRG